MFGSIIIKTPKIFSMRTHISCAGAVCTLSEAESAAKSPIVSKLENLKVACCPVTRESFIVEWCKQWKKRKAVRRLGVTMADEEMKIKARSKIWMMAPEKRQMSCPSPIC